jgi:hypothetical protein
MSGGEGIVLPPLPPPERAPEGEREGAGEGLRVVRRPARVWAADDEPAYVGAPPSPVVTGRGSLGDLPPPSHPWDDIPEASPTGPLTSGGGAGATGFEADPFGDTDRVSERVANPRARWIAGGVVVVLLGVLAVAVQRRGGSEGGGAEAPEVTWRLPAEPSGPSPAVPSALDAAQGEAAPRDASSPPVEVGERGPVREASPASVPMPAPLASSPPPAAVEPMRVSAQPTPTPHAVESARAPAPADRRRLAGVPRTAPAYSVGDGLLVVSANQQGSVWIDGVDAGPVEGFVPVEIPAGRYPVEVRTAQGTRTLEVRVDAGSLRRVQVDFAPAPVAAAAPTPVKARPRRKLRRARPATP